MSAMSRLATAIVEHDAGVDYSARELAALILLGYEPADDITELDVFDAERAAALTYVRCDNCDFSDQAIDMVTQTDGEYLCPSCDYSAYLDWRQL